jgi:hypothetical protein
MESRERVQSADMAIRLVENDVTAWKHGISGSVSRNEHCRAIQLLVGIEKVHLVGRRISRGRWIPSGSPSVPDEINWGWFGIPKKPK